MATNQLIADHVFNVLEEVKFKQSLFVNHPLGREEEYVRDHYMMMLYVVGMIDGGLHEEESAFLKRLALSNGYQDTTAFIQKAMQFSKESFTEFLKLMSTKELKYSFLVDSMLLVRLDGTVNDQELKVLADCSELFKLSTEQLLSLGELAASILEQDTERYLAFYENKKETFPCSLFQHYTVDFAPVVIQETMLNGEHVWKDGSFVVNHEMIVDGSLTISNAKVTFGKRGVIRFVKNASLVIVDSTFDGVEITAEGAQKIEMKHSKFNGKAERNGFQIEECNNVAIMTCSFDNFTVKGRDSGFGAALYFAESTAVIEQSSFMNCRTSGFGGAIFAADSTLQINNAKFSGCSADIGGAIFNNGGSCKLKNSILINSSIEGVSSTNCEIRK